MVTKNDLIQALGTNSLKDFFSMESHDLNNIAKAVERFNIMSSQPSSEDDDFKDKLQNIIYGQIRSEEERKDTPAQFGAKLVATMRVVKEQIDQKEICYKHIFDTMSDFISDDGLEDLKR